MEKTWKPTVAGILDIISGVLGLIWAACLFIGFSVTSGTCGIPVGDVPAFVPGLILAMAIPQTIVSILALIGGIYAVQRKRWGWVLTGSIAAILAATPLGIAAIVFTALSRDEFE